MKKLFSICLNLIILSFLLFSCSSLDNRITGTAGIKVEDNGEITAVAGESNNSESNNQLSPSFAFTGSGQQFVFKKGQKVNISVDNVDFSKVTFVIATDESNNTVKMQTVNVSDAIVYFEKKCQVFTWHEPNYLPKIEVADSVENQQIVLTPMFNDDCEKIGYQIRYGSTERGCREEAKEVLRKFNKCVGGIKVKAKRTSLSEIFDITPKK
ncbi:MAG TPA: hypothetical protein PKY56_10320 [Candidatus Kapabacteria bacterium]|nr:hypothetical protein [Candidatus Kapabacteria bacterium]HPI20755.1 hypothetical protein [Candidatus Kapabacteria bacterium]HPO61495.1 hypothetical protein [Candidatus Kapabacteria bacterium]